jgi:ligand-binding sensor domain-containing protein/two-component sensor histidine kinase
MARKSLYFFIFLGVTLVSFTMTIDVQGEVSSKKQALCFSHITRENGLPSNQVNCFIQDFEGYIWIGTRNGLARYDGHDMTVFKMSPGDQSALPDNLIFSLYQTRDSMIWVGTSAGLAMINPYNGNIRNYPFLIKIKDPVRLNAIWCFFEDADGVLWAGTNLGLLKILPDRKRISVLRISNDRDMSSREFYFNQIYCLTNSPADKRKLLLGTVGGLILYDTKASVIIRDFKKKTGNFPLNPNDIFSDKNGLVWTCGWNIGINCLDIKTGLWKEYPLDKKNPLTVLKMMPGRDGKIWLCTIDRGLGIFDTRTGSFGFFSHDETQPTSIASNETEMASMFNQGRDLWVATQEGISVINRQFHSFEQIAVPFQFSWINAYCQDDKRARLYMGAYSAKGLIEWDERKQSWSLIPYADDAYQNAFCISNIFRDHYGRIWIATRNNLRYLDTAGNCIRLFRDSSGHPLALTDQVIYNISEDHKNNLWVGTRYCGVFCIDSSRGHVTSYRHDNTGATGLIDGTHFLVIKEGRYGRIWMGCRNGVSIFDPETGRFSNHLMDTLEKYGIYKTWINGMETDTLGRMWLAIDGSGLACIDEVKKDRFRVRFYHPGNGLNEQGVGWITRDKQGNFWVVNGGLLYVDPYKEIFHLIDERNGLHERVSWVPMIYTDSRGNIFTSCSHGYETKNIGEIDFSNPLSLKLVPESFEIIGKPAGERFFWPHTGNIILKAEENNLLFRYTAICFDEPGQIHYRYRLLGYDRQWVTAGKSREARYTNLPPGKYKFLISAEGMGKWFQPITAATFEILPVFWKTWWFILTVSMVTIIMITLVYQYRVNQLLKIERMRNTIATDLHDDVSSTLSSISILSELLVSSQGNNESSGMLIEIKNNAKGMLERIDDIIWSVRPRSDKFGDLSLRIREYAIPLFESKKIQFKINIPDFIKGLRLKMDVRWNVYLIAKEAVNNLVKYSDCSNAEIAFSYQDKKLRMEISDNGRGFDLQAENNRNGILNMRERAGKIKGQFEIITSPGKGTLIHFEAHV